MLAKLLGFLPNLLSAAVIFIAGWFIAKLVQRIVTSVLVAAGLDALRILIRLGISKTEPLADELTPSRFAGIVVMTAIMLFAVTEAAALLGFGRLSYLITDFIELAGHVALGLVILALGLFLGDLAAKEIRASNAKQSGLLASAARISIVVLAGAMGLRQMGIANEIIIVAFGLVLGSVAVAVAVALAFGLGAREEAGDVVKQWRARWRIEK